MTTREVIERAERITEAHIYDDGTKLYDILVADKAYSVRVNPSVITQLNPNKDTDGHVHYWLPVEDKWKCNCGEVKV